MRNMEYKTVTKELELSKEPKLWFGDRIFKVEPFITGRSYYTEDRETTFKSVCPCCGDMKTIKIKGQDGESYEATCPLCSTSSGRHDRDTTRITVYNWTVNEYIINEITAQGTETVSDYKNGSALVKALELRAFHRFGRCADAYITTKISTFFGNINPEKVNLEYYSTQSDYAFTTKKAAEKLCAELKAYDKQRLEEFNKKFGTDHEYPY